ncbi:MAG TPA: HAD-IC family P-type ATPase, partial [Armatimonadota bacterium]|nr:HAD-IC family P-type ATPase [Armatimonadota bacterium]
MVVGQGLTSAQAQDQLMQDGYNELPASRHRSILAIAVDVVREPMFLLLLVGGVIYLLLGDIHEALILLAFVLVIMTITFVQERNTARALETLRDLSSPRARVLRDGQTKRIPGREVVRGDFILVSEGDRVPADAILLDCTNMLIDESLLTGESVPVRKAVCEDQQGMESPGGHDRPYVYSGTLVVVGQGIAQVIATGAYTELGKIGHALQSVQEERTPLQRKAGILIKTLALIGGGLSVLVAVIYGVTRGDWLQGILVGITLAMAILPDEFAVILIIFLAVGAWRMSHQRVLTRRIPAVETLGAATVLCVDKTGTITQNSMSVKMLYSQGFWLDIDAPQQHSLPEEVHEVIEYSILASQRDPFDPTERAFLDLGKHTLRQTEHLHDNWVQVREYPLSRQLLSMSHVWSAPGQPSDYIVAAKGAPEAIADLCHLDDKALTIVFQAIRLMADQGLRVLGVAYAIIPKGPLPENQHDFPFQFVGLVGLADPVRARVPESVQECYRAGIRVIMITGDYAATAQSVARQIGLIPVDQVITGDDLRRMRQDELQRRIQTVSIFARVVPEQKLQIVNALKANGEIAAMTGDGVNDAPALRAAHIGIAMGGRGT